MGLVFVCELLLAFNHLFKKKEKVNYGTVLERLTSSKGGFLEDETVEESSDMNFIFLRFLGHFQFPSLCISPSLPLSFLGCYDMRPCCTMTGNDG